MSQSGGGGEQPGQQQFLLVQNNNIIERVVQTSIGRGGQSFTYREPQQMDYGIQEEHMQLQEDSDGGGSTSSGAGGDRGYGADDMIQETGKSPGGHQQKRGGIVVDDKKMRRQIANSNERRRMQSINAGFQSLRNQLPHHEGEKLSKAAILQQTSEYIYSLEQERTQLLSQNCYLKRLLAQHDVTQDLPPSELLTSMGSSSPAAGSAVALVPTSTIIVSGSAPMTTTTTSSTASNGPASKNAGGKKRKMDPVTTIQATTVSDSSDEGLGSMSPEPFTIVLSGKTTKKQQAAALAAAELKQQQQNAQAVAELEQSQRNDIYTVTEITEIEEPCVDFEIDVESSVIEETVIVSERSVPVSAAPLPKKKRITVESVDSSEMDGAAGVAVVNGQITKIFRDLSDMHNGPQEIQELQVLNCDSELVLCSAFPGDSAIAYEGIGPEPIQTTTTTTASKSAVQPLTIIGKLGKAKVAIIDGAMLDKKSKLQPLLDSFNKVENKVEVERITNSPLTMTVVKEEPGTAGAAARAFLGPSTSRQNLETIVEAIRHLEGDRFGEQPKNGRNGVVVKTEALKSLVAELPTQEVPLALTTKTMAGGVTTELITVAQRQAELSQFVHFKTKAAQAAAAAAAANSSSATTTTSSSSSSSSSSNSSSNSSAMPKLTTTSAATGAAATVTVNGQPTSTTIVVRQLQQCRPGVIVAKQSS